MANKVRRLGVDVFTMAYDRLYKEYAAGHRIIIATSGGKDSTCITELAIMAARDAGRLPIEVCTRDEEIMYPGTFEYLERLAERPEVNFRWLIAHMPIVNVFSRKNPYWFTFDTRLDPEQWVRQPPEWHEVIPDLEISRMITQDRFPIEGDGRRKDNPQRLYSCVGIRTSESPQRLLAIHSSGKGSGFDKAHITQPDSYTGTRHLRPIYDWEDKDVWKFIRDGDGTGGGFDYNHAYDTMLRMGHGVRQLRIAPPTMRVAALKSLQMVSGAWPRWFDRVSNRVEGIRTAVQYGSRSLYPERKLGESWQDVYKRTVLGPGNPEWIRERGQVVMEKKLEYHAMHSSAELPDSMECPLCAQGIKYLANWKQMCMVMYMGDAFSLYQKIVQPVEPDVFRPGAGTWLPRVGGIAGGAM